MKKTYTVYYDGTCSLCSGLIKKIETPAMSAQFAMKDVTTNALPENISKEASLQEVHVVDEEGNTYKNIDAIFIIMAEHRVWKKVLWFCKIPMIRTVLKWTYGIVARNRHLLS